MNLATASRHDSPWVAWLCASWLLLCAAPTNAAPVTVASCKALFAKKQYLSLADCFTQLAKQLGAAEKLTPAGRYKKGQYLRNATLALFQSIKQTPANPTNRRLRAMGLLQEYKNNGLCQDKTRCDWAKARIAKLNKDLGLTTTHFVTHHKDATISLKRGTYALQGKGDWSPRLLPGSYTLVVAYPDQQPILRTIQVLTGQIKRYTFTPPGTPIKQRKVPPTGRRIMPPKRVREPAPNYDEPLYSKEIEVRHKRAQRKRRVGMYIGYIGGGSLLGLGVIGILTGAAAWSNAKTEWEKNSTPQSREEELQKQRTNGAGLMAIGWISVAAGVGLSIMGIVFHARHNTKAAEYARSAQPPKPAPTPKAPKTHIFQQWGWTP